MPVLTVFGNFTTKPFAGDDLQIVCFVLVAFRVVQILCIVPILVAALISRFQGEDLIINGYPHWCPQWHEQFGVGDFLVLTVSQHTGNKIERNEFSVAFIVMAGIYAALDLGWILALWGAACMGTPTQPGGRDRYLRSLFVLKIGICIFPIALLIIGIMKVYEVREDNYGCKDQTPDYFPDATWDYVLFSILLVTYALEMLVIPTVIVNKVMRWVRSNKITQQKRYETKAKGERLEQCLGGLLKCLSVVCCNKVGGKELKNKGEMKDFASNLMEFANNDTRVGVVLSDMYVGGKMLARVQAERKWSAIQAIQLQSNAKAKVKEDMTDDAGSQSTGARFDRATLLESEGIKHHRRRSILTLQNDDDGRGCIVVEKNVLSSGNKTDVEVLRNVAHYSTYAQFVYWHVRLALENLIPNDAMTFVRDFGNMTPTELYSFAMFDVPNAHIFYANFHNGIAATPYVILVDEQEKSVVISVRGTISLEDWVIDLQYVPQPLDEVGELCGFEGRGHHCHKGVLTRAKWLYNDLKKKRVLRHLYSSSSIFKNYKLTVVGHSLGGGCAQVLSLMLRPSFPSLKCYAYEPPGCIFDDVLSEDAKEWITSIVRHDDVVPRVTQPNLESLRDEFFDVIARIKVPKYKVFQDVRNPCPESHLESRNSAILCRKGEIDRDTSFYELVRKFRNERAVKNQTSEVSVKLYIPGQVIHLVDTTGDESKYVPYWASRYEFNQVILSGRMLADHSVEPLVDILFNLNLDDVHEPHTWHNEENETSDDEIETLTFVPFSNPQGKLPYLLILLAVAGCVLSSLSSQACRYVTRSSTIYDPVTETSEKGIGMSVGLWAYNLKQCKEAGCDTTVPSNIVDSAYCQEYGRLFEIIDIYWSLARAFGTVAVMLGLISIGIVSTATCTKLKKRTWLALVSLFLVATLCQGLQFLFFKSDLCTEWTHPETFERVAADCSVSTGGALGITTTLLWFATAAGCSHMARMA